MPRASRSVVIRTRVGARAELAHDDIARVLVHVAVSGADGEVALLHGLCEPVHQQRPWVSPKPAQCAACSCLITSTSCSSTPASGHLRRAEGLLKKH